MRAATDEMVFHPTAIAIEMRLLHRREGWPYVLQSEVLNLGVPLVQNRRTHPDPVILTSSEHFRPARLPSSRLLPPSPSPTLLSALPRSACALPLRSPLRLGCPVPIEHSDAAKKVPQADPQPFGDLFDIDQGKIPHPPLDTTVVGAVKPASLRSFFLVDPLFFAHTPDGAAKTDADVWRHSLELSWSASDPYTADESHLSEAVFG